MPTPDEFLIASRVDAARQAITRARVVLLFNVLAATTLLLADFNGYFSWYRYFILAPKVSDLTRKAADFPIDIRENYLKVAQEQLIKSWVDSLVVTVAPLGIRFGVSDIAIVGPAALFVISVVLWYCARRENHTIVRLLRDTHTSQPGSWGDPETVRSGIYHSIASHLVFLPVSEVSKPLVGLKPLPDEKNSNLIRFGFSFLLYFPLLACVAIGLIEVYSNELEAKLMLRTFRDNIAVAVPAAGAKSKELGEFLNHVKTAQELQQWVNNCVAFGLSVLVGLVLKRVDRYSTATIQTLREYELSTRRPQSTE